MGFIYGKSRQKQLFARTEIRHADYNNYASLGTVTVFRGGAGPNGIMRTIGQYMLASGTTFGYVGP